MKTPEEIKTKLIELAGEQAYWRAISIIGTAVFMKDMVFAEQMAAAVKLLEAEGYDKFPEVPTDNSQCCGL